MTQPAFGFPDWLIDEDPSVAFSTFLRNKNLKQGNKRFFQRESPNIYDDFLGFLGNQITQGTVPTTSYFNEFLPTVNFSDYMRRFSPIDRGQGTGQFRPRTQFNFFNR